MHTHARLLRCAARRSASATRRAAPPPRSPHPPRPPRPPRYIVMEQYVGTLALMTL